MSKVAAVKLIMDKLDLVDYLEDTARYIKVGPFKIESAGDNTWEIIGPNVSIWLSTRMGAMGYAKCLTNDSPWMADKILTLDHAVGLAHNHMQSVAQASRLNESLGAKRQQAEDRYKEAMRQLSKAVFALF